MPLSNYRAASRCTAGQFWDRQLTVRYTVDGVEVVVDGEVDDWDVVLVVVEVVVLPQADMLMVLLSIVTAPVCAKALPSKVAWVAREMLVDARILPRNDVPTPSVAELTTRHQMLHDEPPPRTLAVPEVMSVDADLKIQTPEPLSVSVPSNVNAAAQ